MSRIRVLLLSMGLVVAVLMAQSVSQAQAPGNRGDGGRGGRGGFGGFFGRNRVSSPLRLASNTYVQEDLKLTAAQKEQIKALSDKVEAERKNRGGRGNNGGGPGENGQGQRAPEGQAKAAPGNGDAPKADNGGARDRGGRNRGGPSTNGGDNAANGGNRGPRGFNNGGFGGGPNFDNAGFAAFRERMEKQQAENDAALAKILTKPQRERILQIQLRQEGPMAVTKEAMQKKLNFSPQQSQQIAMILEERDQAQSSLRDQGREMFAAFRTTDGRFDGEALRARMQDPQFKAEMDKRREMSGQQMEHLQDQTIAMIGKTMTKKQHLNFQKMQGPPFDLAKLDPNYDPAAAKAKAKAEGADESDEADSSSKKGSSTKKKTSTRSRRGN